MAKNYLNNADLLVEIKKSHANKDARPDDPAGSWITDPLAAMLLELVNRYGSRHNWRGYTYNDEMRGLALENLVRSCLKFDPGKGSNPFGYYTQIVTHSFLTLHNKEKRQREIRDSILVEAGQLPSWDAQERDLANQHKKDSDTS